MKRQMWTGAVAAAALAFGVSMAAQTSSTQSSAGTVTVTGCLQRADSMGGATGTSGSATSGSSSASASSSSDGFVLANAKMGSGSSSGMSGSASGTSGAGTTSSGTTGSGATTSGTDRQRYVRQRVEHERHAIRPRRQLERAAQPRRARGGNQRSDRQQRFELDFWQRHDRLGDEHRLDRLWEHWLFIERSEAECRIGQDDRLDLLGEVTSLCRCSQKLHRRFSLPRKFYRSHPPHRLCRDSALQAVRASSRGWSVW